MSDEYGMVWEDPPPKLREPWVAKFIERLQEHPGKWARVKRPDGSDTFTNGMIGRFTKPGCQVRSSTKDGRVHLWARWPEVEP